MIDNVCEIITERGRELVLTEKSKYIIGQLSLWLSNDNRFKGDLKKGIMLRGPVGTGKTVIIKAFVETMFQALKIKAKYIHSTELHSLYMEQKNDEIDVLKSRIYTVIDDVGVEMVEAKTWGNTREPFNDIFDYRYRENKITIITTNLKPSDIETQYGTRIIDRFRESFNDFVLDGNSFRK